MGTPEGLGLIHFNQLLQINFSVSASYSGFENKFRDFPTWVLLKRESSMAVLPDLIILSSHKGKGELGSLLLNKLPHF